MTIADDPQKPNPEKKLAKSLDAIAALRIAMEQRLAEQQRLAEAQTPAPPPPPPEPPAPTVAPEPIPQQVDPTPTAQQAPEPPPHPKPTAAPKEPKSAVQPPRPFDPSDWPRVLFRIGERSQKLISEYLERTKNMPQAASPLIDPAHLLKAYADLTNRILQDPEHFAQAQIRLWQGYVRIWQSALARAQGKETPPIVSPAPGDKRFKDAEWQSNWVFDFLKQSYLMTAQWVHGVVQEESAKLEPHEAHKLEFYTRQMVDAISPSNFWMTNPEVLRATFESGGDNLVKGLENLLNDLERGQGQLRISMSDLKAFKVGENMATTPGQVVYQNHLMQLIQYAPQTETAHAVPLLIIPPWINKYYILDLREKNSLINYLVQQGFTVFCISWVNPDARHANVNFEDYMTDGALQAMQQIATLTNSEQINVVGYCIGGTLLATTLAYLDVAPIKPANLPTITSATYLVTLTDFSEPGDLGVFIDEEQIKAVEERMKPQGYLDASAMATTFNMLRANDLIWSFVINNYLLGKEPFPFDILYWNGDSTNLPAAMQSYYLREMYLNNRLVEPNALRMKGVPIDLTRITTPSFMLSTRDDHIAPWKSTYAATQIYKGPIKFVLAGSGHIAGIINPPSANKYGYWTNDALPTEPDAWLAAAQQHDGSWWPEWLRWLSRYSGDAIPAPQPHSSLESAPGSYVKVKAG